MAVTAFFGYGIPRIIEVGIYIRGTIMKLAVTPGVSFQHIVPLQLIPDLQWISELMDDNKFALALFVDL